MYRGRATRRKPGQALDTGLTPPAVLSRLRREVEGSHAASPVTDTEALRNPPVPEAGGDAGGQVLPSARPGGAGEAGGGGLSGAPGNAHAHGSPGSQPRPVLDGAAVTSRSGVEKLLRDILAEPAAFSPSPDSLTTTKMEATLRSVVAQAVRGDAKGVEFVLHTLLGKPGVAPVKAGDMAETEDKLDRACVARLNEITNEVTSG